jgi:hypothetical protein
MLRREANFADTRWQGNTLREKPCVTTRKGRIEYQFKMYGNITIVFIEVEREVSSQSDLTSLHK